VTIGEHGHLGRPCLEQREVVVELWSVLEHAWRRLGQRRVLATPPAPGSLAAAISARGEGPAEVRGALLDTGSDRASSSVPTQRKPSSRRTVDVAEPAVDRPERRTHFAATPTMLAVASRSVRSPRTTQ
jgi:hypothetical protein